MYILDEILIKFKNGPSFSECGEHCLGIFESQINSPQKQISTLEVMINP